MKTVSCSFLGSGGTEKKKPTIEINPLTKEDNPKTNDREVRWQCTHRYVGLSVVRACQLSYQQVGSGVATFTLLLPLLLLIAQRSVFVKQIFLQYKQSLYGIWFSWWTYITKLWQQCSTGQIFLNLCCIQIDQRSQCRKAVLVATIIPVYYSLALKLSKSPSMTNSYGTVSCLVTAWHATHSWSTDGSWLFTRHRLGNCEWECRSGVAYYSCSCFGSFTSA